MNARVSPYVSTSRICKAQQSPGALKIPKTGVGQRYAARRAVQQTYLEALLELPHRMAERRRRDTEPRRRGGSQRPVPASKSPQARPELHGACPDVPGRSLMTIPGVGRLTALAFAAAIDDPDRFRRSRDVGAPIWA
jgi:transposase